MAKKTRIKIPLSQHWNHFRQAVLPFICFFGCVVLTVWLWQRQAFRGSLVGEVEMIMDDATATIDGLLLPLAGPVARDQAGNPISQGYWESLGQVTKGQPIARLDDSVLRAQRAELTALNEQLRAELDATAEQIEVRIKGIENNYNGDLYRRMLERDQAQLAINATEVKIAEIFYNIEVVNVEIAFLESVVQKGAGSLQDLRVKKKEKITLEQTLEFNQKLRREQKAAFARAETRLKDYKNLGVKVPALDKMLEAKRKAGEVLSAQMERNDAQLAQLIIRAPISGRISTVNRYPGSAVTAGESIVTIIGEESKYIVSYWREKTATRPAEKMPVKVRLPLPGSKQYDSQIAQIGPAVVPIPPHQLKDQSMTEYGTPVKIPIPSGLALKPGELVHIVID